MSFKSLSLSLFLDTELEFRSYSNKDKRHATEIIEWRQVNPSLSYPSEFWLCSEPYLWTLNPNSLPPANLFFPLIAVRRSYRSTASSATLLQRRSWLSPGRHGHFISMGGYPLSSPSPHPPIHIPLKSRPSPSPIFFACIDISMI